jgi:hypothetical protein
VPTTYYQGLTSDSAEGRAYFVGVFTGLWRTTPRLLQTAGVANAIPPSVTATEGYNHIGDPTWNSAEGGRLILPLECYQPGVGNTCGTGSFGVADPDTLAWRYYVKLDPTEIPKAMWAESSPDGRLIWTSSGDDLLAYRSSDVTATNAAPGADRIRSVRRLVGAVPPTGITGAVFDRGRLLLAGESNGTYQVWAIDTRTGTRRLELETNLCGESEGLDRISTLGGDLHWLIAPFDPGCQLSYGPTSALLHFVRTPGFARLAVTVTRVVAGQLPGEVQIGVRVTRAGRPVRFALVTFAGARTRTNRYGSASLRTVLIRPGRYKALAQQGASYGLSALTEVGIAPQTPTTGLGPSAR